MKNTLVIIPTYNEKENIELIIKALLDRQQELHVLVVDDNSPDGTASIVQKTIPQYSDRLYLENRAGKGGLGTAYIHGFKWALSRNYEFIFEMDADFSHDPEDVPILYQACLDNNADLVIGSRYVKGVNVVNWPMSRVLLSYCASKYVQWITRMNINDTTAGFVCYRADLLKRFNLDKIKFIGYAFQIELKFKAYLLKAKIIEVPVIFTDRSRGKSKMDGGIIQEAISGVLWMKIKSLFGTLQI